MRKKTKKLLSLFLAVLMAMSSLSAAAIAYADSQPKIYDGLDDNYQALAQALTKDYVTTAQYDVSDRTVTVTDNESKDVYTAVKAFYDIFATMDYTKDPPSNQSNLVNFANDISNVLKVAMGNDYTSAMEKVVTKYFNGLGSASNANSANDYVITVNYSPDAYLSEYDKVSDLPDSISSSARFTYTVKKSSFLFWNYYPCSSISENDAFTSDTQSTEKLKAYDKLFSETVLNTAYDKLDKDLFSEIEKNGQSAIDGVSSFSENVYNHFFTFKIEDAQKYLDGLLISLIQDYKDIISQLKTLCEGKSEEDFDFSSLEKVKELLDSADKLYSGYTDKQKEAVKSEYSDYEKYNTLYIGSFNYNVKNEYQLAVSQLEKYVSDSYVISRGELDTIKTQLDKAQSVYDKFIGEVTDSQVLSLKETYDKAKEKYETAVEKFEWEDYFDHIRIIADKFSKDALAGVSSDTVTDTADNDILAAMDAYVFSAKFLFEKDSKSFSDSGKISIKICEDLKSVMGSDYEEKNVSKIITQYMGGGVVSADSTEKTFTVIPLYLSRYSSISDIPETISYDVTTYKFSHNVTDNVCVLSDISKSVETKTDTDAYKAFNEYEKVFTDELMSSAFINFSIDELAQIRNDAENALNGVSQYDENTVNSLVKTPVGEAKGIVEKCDDYSATKFFSLVQSLEDDYTGRDVLPSEIPQFNSRCTVIDNAYGKLSEIAKNKPLVVKAVENYENVKSQLKAIQDLASAQAFERKAVDFVLKYPDSSLVFEINEQFTAELTVLLEEYASLNDEAKAMQPAVNGYNMLTIISDKMEKVVIDYYYSSFISASEKYLTPYFTDVNGTAEIKSLNIFDVSNVNSAVSKVRAAYDNLNEEKKADEKVLYYMDVVTKLENKVKELVGNPNFNKYDVEYPDNITSAQVEDVMSRLDTALGGDMIKQLLGKSLDQVVMDAISGKLFNENTVNTAITTLYPVIQDAVSDYASYLGLVGLYVTPKTVSERTAMDDYPIAQSILAAAGDNWENVVWQEGAWTKTDGTPVHDIVSFCDALGAGLQGINNAIKALLTGDSIKALGLITIISGNEGYDKDILPLLEVLGCDVVSTADFKSRNNLASNMLKDILIPLMNRVEDILSHDTLTQITEILPDLSYVMTYDLLTKGVEDLGSPLSGFGFNLNQLLLDNGIDLSDIIGVANKFLGSTGLVLPELNWAQFAGIGEWQTNYPSKRSSGVRNHIEAIKPDVFVQFVYYLASVLKTNSEFFEQLVSDKIGNNSAVSGVLSGVFGNIKTLDDKTVAGAILTQFIPYETADYNWETFNWKKTNIKYTSYSSKDIEALADTLSEIVTNVINLLLDGSLDELVGDKLYTGETVNLLFKAIYNALDDETISKVLSLVKVTDSDGKVYSIDVSKDGVSQALKDDYSKVSKALDKAVTISGAVISADDWKVKDAQSFAKAVNAVLSPFAPLLKALLAGQGMTVTVADVLKIYGAGGYNNAVKPLLDALTCDTMSVTDFEKEAEKDFSSTLYNIINPLLELVDKVTKDPVNAVIDIAPKAALFIDNGGVQTAVEQLLAPFNNMFSAFSTLAGTDNIYQFLFDNVLSDLAGVKLDWDNLQNQIVPIINQKLLNDITISGYKTSLSLPQINWSLIAGCMTSNNGKVVRADSTVQILKYVWKAVQTNKNSLLSLIKQAAGNDTYNTLSPYITKLLNIKDDKAIEILVKLTKGLDASSFKADWSFLYKNYNATSVKLPQGVTENDLKQVADILSSAVNNVISTLLDTSLTGLVSDKLYTNDTVTTLAKAVYSLGEDKTLSTVLTLFGVDLSKDAVAKSLKKDYPTVAKSISSAKSISNADTSKWNWKIKDSESFAQAITAVLRPLNSVLNLLLNSGEISVAGVVDFKGANGYSNAVKPLLDALGCDTLSVSQYAKSAKRNSDNLVLNVINPLLEQVDTILSNPVKEIALILPQASNFIDKGGVQKAVENLLYPVTNLLSPLLSVMTNESIFDFLFDILGVDINWNNLQNDIVPMINGLLSDGIKINSKKLNLTLVPFDWGTLAGCGTVSGNSVKANTAKELMVVIRYVFDLLKVNQNAIISLAGGANNTLSTVIGNIIKCGADDFTKIVVNILLKMKTFDNVLWTFKNVSQSQISYTENYGEKDYAQALSMTDPLIEGLLRDFTGGSLKSFATGALYTNNIVNTLTKLIYTNLEGLDIGVDINTVLSLIDVDISTKAVASEVSDYKSVSKQLSKYSKWSSVDFNKLNWGFKDGDREGFVNALTAVLRPLYPVLRAVLSGEDLVVLGSVKIKGGNGYNTAIVPIAEALGISEKSLVSPEKYASQADSDKLITNIINPLLDRAEQLLDSPVTTLADALPNVAYFITNGGLKDSVSNLIAPVTNILREIKPIYSLDIDLSMLENPDLAGMINGVIGSIKINGNPLNIKLSSIDLNTLAGRGTLKTYTSVRTYNGERMKAKHVEADSTAVFISVLRYLISNIKTNLDAINALLAGLSIPANVLDIINQLLTALASEDVDSVIEMLMELLFGFGSADGAAQSDGEKASDPFKLGNFYWAYWVFLAGVALILAGVLYFILRKKKNKENQLTELTEIEEEDKNEKGI